MTERWVASGRLSVSIERLARGPKMVLEQVRFSCEPGTHLAILGPNGAGKTTLLKAVLGLLDFEGEVHVDGRPLAQMPSRLRAKRIAYVPQRSDLSSGLSVREVVMQGRFAHHRGLGLWSLADRRAVDAALEMTDVGSLAHRSYLELSGGEQRRVLLARALATEAPIVALDEPTAGLDLCHALLLFRRLGELTARGQSVITVLHDLRDAERWCDRALLLERGRVCYEGSATLPEGLINQVYGVQSVPNSAPSYHLEHKGAL